MTAEPEGGYGPRHHQQRLSLLAAERAQNRRDGAEKARAQRFDAVTDQDLLDELSRRGVTPPAQEMLRALTLKGVIPPCPCGATAEYLRNGVGGDIYTLGCPGCARRIGRCRCNPGARSWWHRWRRR